MPKTLWSPQEDEILKRYVEQHGSCDWNQVVRSTGLHRCPKSCRRRWVNYLRPGLKRSPFSSLEARLLLSLHKHLGNSWSKIASHIPGRSDNDVKNFWHTYARRRRSRSLASMKRGAEQHRVSVDVQSTEYVKLPNRNTADEEVKLPIILNDISIFSQSQDGYANTQTKLLEQDDPRFDESPNSRYSPASFTLPDPALSQDIVLSHMNHQLPWPKGEDPAAPEGLYRIVWKFMNNEQII